MAEVEWEIIRTWQAEQGHSPYALCVAAEACRVGPRARDQLDEAVEGWVAAILKNGPRAIRLQKALLREWENLPLDQAVVRGIEYVSEAYKTDEPGTLMRHFLQRSQRKKQ